MLNLRELKYIFALLFFIPASLIGVVDDISIGIGAGLYIENNKSTLSTGLEIELITSHLISPIAKIKYANDDLYAELLFKTKTKIYPIIGISRDLPDKAFFIPIGLGTSFKLLNSYSLFTDLSYYKTINTWRKNAFNVNIGLNYHFCLNDLDHDGIINKYDNCPDTPKKVKVDKTGCPLDSDGDGVFDVLDKCEDTPFSAFVDSLGCPFDTDNDGIFDGVDLCPGTPQDIIVDSIGCPIDTDKDGIPDFEDSCKTTPKGAIVDRNGCETDSDYDGVPDGIDKCPKTPTGIEINEDGCPLFLPITFEVVYDPLDEFGALKNTILKGLDLLAQRIRAYPTRIIEISGYTDSEGSAPYNIGRAKQMVSKIKDYIVSKGVSQDSIKLAFYGEINFIADNSTPQGRAKNRRVEFKFISEKSDSEKTKGK